MECIVLTVLLEGKLKFNKLVFVSSSLPHFGGECEDRLARLLI